MCQKASVSSILLVIVAEFGCQELGGSRRHVKDWLGFADALCKLAEMWISLKILCCAAIAETCRRCLRITA